ncbi:hypothetical protein AVEN_185719-1 [Araneus ventricosus]|uniref:Uncharacterized protein n=1 Tax=Araneus ventricosus TaxID=182803 RepID=A0A4Y2UDF2_ARAVE|nr:hypothetical protein AVEN_185719-1 [Araneus ventricosus]
MFTDSLEVNIATLALIEATAEVIQGRNITPMDHTVTITLNLVINVILINVKAHVAGGVGKLRPAVDSTAGSASDELKDCRNTDYSLLIKNKFALSCGHQC